MDPKTVNTDIQERALPLDVAIDEDGGRTMSGYAVRWNELTDIGNYMERFAPGSWDDSITQNRVKVIFNHGRSSSQGDKPIASLSHLSDDGTGAKYDAELLAAPYVDELMPGLRAGLYGSSFRFRALDQEINRRPSKSADNPEGKPEVTIKRAAILELGPTTFPAYAGSTASVRSQDVTPQPKQETAKANRPAVTHYSAKAWYLR